MYLLTLHTLVAFQLMIFGVCDWFGLCSMFLYCICF